MTCFIIALTFFLPLRFLIFRYVYVCVFMCLCTCVQMPSRGQKRSSDPLNVELEVVVSCHECWGLKSGSLQLLILLQLKLPFYQRNYEQM